MLIPLKLEDAGPRPTSTLPHVLLVVDQFPKALGGGERTVLRLAELLPQYGFRASVLTFSIHPESSVLAAPLSFPFYLLPLDRTYDLRALRAAFMLRRFLRQQEIQIVETFFESSDLWAGCVVKALSTAKLVWSRRDMGILRSAKHRVAYRLLSKMPDHVFAVSDGVRQHCIETDGVDPSRVLTIYNGVDPGVFLHNTTRDPNSFCIATLGNIRRVKGHDLLIRAAAIVLKQFPDVLFSVAGEILEPDFYQELQQMIRDLAISDRFHFVGGSPAPRQYLSGADLFVLPSRSEGFSYAILEAMSCSLPVIATAVGGNAEAVQDGVTGLMIPAEDAAALALSTTRFIADRAEAKRMGEAGRLLAETRFSTGAMMKEITSAYRALLTNR